MSSLSEAVNAERQQINIVYTASRSDRKEGAGEREREREGETVCVTVCVHIYIYI